MYEFGQNPRLRASGPNKVTIEVFLIMAFVGLLISTPARADQAVITFDRSFYAAGTPLKIDNGLLVAWVPSSDENHESQIKTFDSQGRELMSLNLLESLEGAKKAVISDVSVNSDGMVAVGAQVFKNKDHSKSMMLLLGSDGQLYKSISFDTGLGVLKLQFDDDGNIWVLRMGAGMADPAQVPVLAEYDRDGNLIGEFLHFSDFAKDARIVHGGHALGGDACMGVTQTRVSFWLPSSRELVTVFKDGTGIQRLTTGLPTRPDTQTDGGMVRARKCNLNDSDGLLCQVSFLAKPPDSAKAQTALYQFTNDTHEWRPAPQASVADHAGVFLGVDKNTVIFVIFDSDKHEIALESVPLVP